jgi:hypothetical protein
MKLKLFSSRVTGPILSTLPLFPVKSHSNSKGNKRASSFEKSKYNGFEKFLFFTVTFVDSGAGFTSGCGDGVEPIGSAFSAADGVTVGSGETTGLGVAAGVDS